MQDMVLSFVCFCVCASPSVRMKTEVSFSIKKLIREIYSPFFDTKNSTKSCVELHKLLHNTRHGTMVLSLVPWYYLLQGGILNESA